MDKNKVGEIIPLLEKIGDKELIEEIIVKSIDKINKGIKEKEYKKIIDKYISNNIFLQFNHNEKNSYNFKKILNYNVINLQKLSLEGKYNEVKNLVKILKNIAIPNDIKRKYNNIILNELEIAEHKIVLESKPRFLYCTVTSSCNIKCIMCKVYNHHWEISDKLFKSITDLLPTLETVVWQGGEVFLYKNFDELLDVAGKYKVGQELVTNAILLNEQRILKLINYNVNLGISIDGLTKEVYESIRIGSDFNKLIQNLEILKANLTDKNNLRLNVLIMDKNIDQIQYYPEFAKKYGFSQLCVNALSPHTKIKENIFYYNKNKKYEYQLMNIKKILRSKCEDLGIELIDTSPNYILDEQDIKPNECDENIKYNENKYERDENNECNAKEKVNNLLKEDCINDKENIVLGDNKLFCRVPWQRMYIDSYGNVTPECFCDFNKSIGSVQNNSLEEIWNGEKMQEYRRCIVANKQSNICFHKCLKKEFGDNILNRIIDSEPF
jgi:sulfatase maturation enzyme AslB (radical SAM superfamily)